MRTIWLGALAMGLAACSGSGAGDNGLTKGDARNRGGKSDEGADFCALYDWYGDGVCDDFCPSPDTEDCPHCGGLGGLRCGNREYCSYELDQTCGAADQMGICKPRPDVCALTIRPVCGCDGVTYDNECFAARSGASVARDGTCEDERHCGGHLGLRCEDREFCRYDVDEMCGAADHLGTCQPRPDVCAEIFAPVCGCDRQTYGNECEAARDGATSVASEGECGSQGGTTCEEAGGECTSDPMDVGFAADCEALGLETLEGTCEAFNQSCCGPAEVERCGGFAGLTCGGHRYCYYRDDQSCGFADQMGECRPRPDVCAEIFAPVCGCNGRTYGNECEAARDGASVASSGEC